MPQGLTASLDTATSESAIPKAIYNLEVSEEQADLSKKTGAPMLMLRFKITDGEYAGRDMPGRGGWFYIMAGGKKEDGTPHSTRTLFETVNALKAEWTCGSCSTTSTAKFLREKVSGAVYHFFCPHCHKRADVRLDGSWLGLRCKGKIDTEKIENSDEERNKISSLIEKD